ncbi:DUF2730 domain-containing protein [Endozoicomonas gorgoniicola]|uniref:DUF2730 domain-containing protein n=1 Tax=Endozoicomonas gorgoniicola TaxID=1234144 RepID=A0ABT3MT76_9GAMM|nr:DUF2730 domain-containing protein [Endozoicomonas gorgoniicola]MCW7552575.1 DUF2730 domain-containing protein [Endozoicomonas gorgoniicola]
MPVEMDYGAARFWWDVVQSLALLALFIWTALDKRRQKNTQGIDAVRESQKKQDRRIQRLEDNQERLATHEDLSDIKSDLSGLQEKITAQNNLLQTIHQFLLTNKKGE